MKRRAGRSPDPGRLPRLAAVLLAALVGARPAGAAELRPQTVEAWQHYVRAAETRIERELASTSQFLGIDFQEASKARVERKAILSGQVVLSTANTGPPISDSYLRFLVEEFKPFIDGSYRTLTDAAHTSIMGSSMGAMVSLYALCEYPQVFGSSAGISTHWPSGVSAMRDYLERRLPRAGTHRIYFDFGTLGLDAAYEPYQVKVDAVMAAKGYRQPNDWATLKFAGTDHDERDWRARLHLPFLFLLAGRR